MIHAIRDLCRALALTALIAASLASTGHAQQAPSPETPPTLPAPMSAEEFEKYVAGRTLFFLSDGSPYGAETYLPNRRVRWSYLDGKCQEGIWYALQNMICFEYTEHPTPQCWVFRTTQRGLHATFQGDPEQTILYEAIDAPEKQLCLGPELGA